MKKKRYLFYLLILLFAVSLGMAAGEKAEELTGSARFETNGGEKNYTLMTDGDLKTYFPLKEKKGILTISCEKPIHGVYIMVFDKYGRGFGYDLQIPEGDGWKTVEQGGEYLVQWHEMEEPTTEIRIAATAKERMRIAEIRLFGEGESPAEIQKWETLDKADLMLLTAHPDDEILWFAGLMPVYGGERKLKLQVTVMVPTGGQRKLELLSAIWHCGVKYYPEMLGFVDKNRKNPDDQYKAWRGKDRVISKVVEVIRKHQPEVVITHGEKGEYGHGAHKTAADAAKAAYRLAAKSTIYSKSLQKYGTWQVKKLYLHEYEQNQMICDWNYPLQRFGGKTGYEVAEEAFQFHGSQVQRDWNFEVHGEHDNAVFGLYYTEVGPDTGIGDLMEHIELTEVHGEGQP